MDRLFQGRFSDRQAERIKRQEAGLLTCLLAGQAIPLEPCLFLKPVCLSKVMFPFS